jgi:hypothetical protein
MADQVHQEIVAARNVMGGDLDTGPLCPRQRDHGCDSWTKSIDSDNSKDGKADLRNCWNRFQKLATAN